MFGKVFGGDKKDGNSVQDKIKKAKRIKMVVMALGAALPIIGNILLGLLVAVIVMFPIMYIGEKIEGFFKGVGKAISTTSEKMLNLAAGEGWFTNEEAYFKKLEEEYKKFNEYPNAQGEFDVALLAATTHYSKMIDTTIYTPEDECSEDNPNYDKTKCSEDFDTQGPPVVDEDETKNFYHIALDSLGSAYTLWPGEKKLIGHLVSTKFNTRCVTIPTGWNIFDSNSWDQISGSLGDLLDSIVQELKNGLVDTAKDISDSNLIKLATSIWVYAQDPQSAGYIKTELENLKYEIKADNFIENIDYIMKVSEKEMNWDCSYMGTPPESYKWVAVPMIVKYIDYERYTDYLKNVYIPVRFQNHLLKIDPEEGLNEWYSFEFYEGLTDKQKRAIDNIVDEIFAMRDSYVYLMGDARNNALRITGMNSLPVQIGAGENWNDPKYVSRGFQLGTAKCFVNGVWNGNTNCNHLAIDFSWTGCENTPIYAIAKGVIIKAEDKCAAPNCGYGLHIIIGHDIDDDDKYEYYSLYAHLNTVYVEEGDEVQAGEKIGLLGSTGNSTGAHLHFEIQDEKGLQIDPTPILNGIVAGTNNPLAGAMICGMYTNEQINSKNATLNTRVEASGKGTRDGVVAAAKYLSNEMGVIIPYWYGGKYTSLGINSEWGCNKAITDSEGTDKQLPGSVWPYGLDCSGFVSWAIRNGGYKASNIAVGSDDQGNMTDDYISWGPTGIEKVKPGDLAWKNGHIGMIIDVNVADCKYYVAEEKGANYGLVVSEISCTGGNFTRIILMDDFYNNDDNKEAVNEE